VFNLDWATEMQESLKIKNKQAKYNPELGLAVRFEVLTAVVMKSSIFWDITLCSSLKVN
jgi:hypothetical protein